MGIIRLSQLRLHDKIILLKWHGETSGLCFEHLEDGDLYIPLQPTCSYFYLWTKVPGYILLPICLCPAMLVSPRGTTFYFTTKTTSPLFNFWGNKLQECILTSFMQALIHLLPLLVKVFWQVLVQKLCVLNFIEERK